jgi:hypothetical protein
VAAGLHHNDRGRGHHHPWAVAIGRAIIARATSGGCHHHRGRYVAIVHEAAVMPAIAIIGLGAGIGGRKKAGQQDQRNRNK